MTEASRWLEQARRDRDEEIVLHAELVEARAHADQRQEREHLETELEARM